MSLYQDASLAMIPSAVKDGKLYSIKPTDGSGDFTFTRGSNLAATRVDVNGLIEKGRENLLLQSNQFDTTWFNASTSETGGQSGYDGLSGAWKVDLTGVGGYIAQAISNANINTISVYAKAGTLNWIRLRVGITPENSRYFDLENGVIGLGGTAPIDAKIESVGSGWYRCSITTNISFGRVYFYPAIGDDDVTASSGSIYIQDAQLEVGLVATDYIETTTTTEVAGITEDMPRLDYSGGASCPSLLLEPQRSNLVTQSEYINGSGLSKIGSSIDTNVSSSPEGLVNASLLKEDSSNGSHVAYRDFNLTNGATYTISIFAKSNGENRNIRLGDGGGFGWSSGFNSDFDLTLGTSTNNGVIEDYGNGWYRCSVVGTTNATTSRLIIYSILNTADSYQGNGTSGVYLYGFQLEQASYPTSYIPTYGTSQTRSKDAMANLDIPDFNDNTSFSVLLELTRNGISSSETGSMFSFYNDSLTQQFWFHIDAPISQVRLRDATNSNATMATISFNTDDRKKIAFSCDGSTLKTYADGVLSNTYNLVNVFNVDELRTAATSFDVHQILTFPTALTDSECIALTQ